MTEALHPSSTLCWHVSQKATEIMSDNEHNKKRPSDEVLVAFADGLLSEDERAQVARFLEGDAEARELVARLQESGRLAVEAFDEVLNSPPPDRLLEAIMGAPASKSTSVIQFPTARRKPSWLGNGPSMAIAASLMLVAGVSLWALRDAPVTGAPVIAAGPVLPGSALEQILETRKSGDPIELTVASAKAELVVMNSFYDGAGRICRELEVSEGASMHLAVGCRAAGKGWTVEGVAQVAGSPQDGDTFRPAGGQTTSTIDSVLARLGAKAPLSKEAEDALIAQRWRAE